METKISKVILSDHIFDAVSDETYRGYIVIRGQKIESVGKGNPEKTILEGAEEIINVKEGLVMPGIVDCHTFFTGYAVAHVGADFSDVMDRESGLAAIRKYVESNDWVNVALGHGWNPQKWRQQDAEAAIEAEYPDRAVVVFAKDRGSCIVNRKAQEKYQLTSGACFPEMYYRVMKEYLNDQPFIEQELKGYMDLLNERGVTCVKEMGFDDFYGFTDILSQREKESNFNLRFFFASQPVGESMNLSYARKMRKKFTGNKVRFCGFNRMTDGTIASGRGDLKEPYENESFTCAQRVDYREIEREVLAADAEGFPYSLHCQGNKAVAMAAAIFEKCQMENGKLKNRHALTDMEFSDVEDIQRLGEIGASAELYFQIMSLDSDNTVLENIERTIGKERGKNYWNRRKMQELGMNLCGATDLPLMFTSVPEAIYHSCGGYLKEGTVFQPENAITIPEMLKAWTIGGQKNLGMEYALGTLEKGKLADIAVFDRDLTKLSPKECKDAKVLMTILDGNIVYKRQEEENGETDE